MSTSSSSSSKNPSFTLAEDPKKRRGSWFSYYSYDVSLEDDQNQDADVVYVDAAHGVGDLKIEALVKVCTEFL